STGFTATLSSMLSQPATRSTALELIVAAERVDFIEKVEAIILDSKAERRERLLAAYTLGLLPPRASVPMLARLSRDQRLEADLRHRLVDALGHQLGRRLGADAREALEVLKSLVLAKREEVTVREAAVSALVGSRQGSLWLLERQVYEKIPEPLQREL